MTEMSPHQLMVRTSQSRYGRMAFAYDALAHLLSGGSIRATKRAQLQDIRPSDRVLYAGVGGGEDAVMAARAGARITVIDLAPGMIAKAQRRFRREGVHEAIETLTGNVLCHRPAIPYDVVCANFFLNVFSSAVKREVLAHLCTLVRPGGKMLIADFTPAEGSLPLRLARWINFGISILSCSLIARNALHTLYDYQADLKAARLQLERITHCGPFYCTLTARAPSALARQIA